MMPDLQFIVIVIASGITGGAMWWSLRRSHVTEGLLPNKTFEYTLDVGDILMLFRDRSVLVAVLHDDGTRADMITLTLADEVDFTTARMALLKAEQDGLRDV